MAQNISEIISRQETIFNNLKQISINYKKDGPSRKTLEYLEERLSRLNTNWEKFVYNHQQLEKSGITDIQHFVDDVFNNTKKMYEDVLQDILKRKAELPSVSKSKVELPPSTPEQGKTKATFSFDDINFHVPPRETDKTNEKQQELLRQQYCRALGSCLELCVPDRAFERTVEKINFDSSSEKWELEDSLNILKGKWDLIEKTNWELDYISQDEDSIYKQKYDAIENVYDNFRKKLQHHIWNNAHYEKTTPKIVIPDFNGNYHQWLTFKDLYLESVHNNPLLSKAQKMQHLKTKLKGEAEKIVQHLGISAENYTSCWEIITHRYDNKRLLFTSYMNTLLNQPVISEASAASIRKLHDVTLECLNGLSNIGLEISNWDPIIVHLLVQKLDKVTYNEYIKDLKEPREFPDLDEFTKFMENKFMALEAIQGNTHQRSPSSNKNQTSDRQHNNASNARNNKYNSQRSSNSNRPYKSSKAFFTTTRNCPICKTEHVLMKCCKFLAMNAKERNDTVRNLRICANCLYSHGEQKCTSRKTCKLCNKSHHTLLHEDENEQNNRPAAMSTSMPSTTHAVNNLTNEAKEILLTTVLLKVKTIDGDYISLRGLLDQGSQVSLVTEHAAQRLRLPRRKVSAIVSGVGSLSGNCKGSINLECKSIHSDYEFKLETLVMKKLVNNLPTASFSIHNWDYIENLKLADPHFNKSGPIDLLLGAEIYSELILNGVIKSDNFPVAQQTRVGWILCGNVKTFNCYVILNDLENMTRFWETEEISDTTTSTNENQHCEEYYNSTTKRLDDGKYVVQMPMKPNYNSNLGATKSQAQAQFLQLERKMLRNNDLNREYKRFMEEYISLGHMIPVTAATRRKNQVYLPHHGVLRAESTTTKLRVVFNASYKANNNNSLNDLMYSGPNLQKDMFTLLINWRVYRYVFTADIEKMYRHIWLNEQQQHLQTIVWRSSPNEPLLEWQLCTVTYGMKSAPYLAMRTLHQLAQDEKDNYPESVSALLNYFYMDDLVHGQNSIEDSKRIVAELIQLLSKGGFNLRKWTSNEATILEDLRDDQKSTKANIEFSPETTNTKMLGMSWNQKQDTFTYQWRLPEKRTLTKRVLLSEISKLYDPLGFLSPATIKAKLLFQKVWISKIDWDDSLPGDVTAEWEKLRKDFPSINKISIPRWLRCTDDNIEIHGFCDASEKAYACVIYSRVKSKNGNFTTTIITAKTKVAPLSKKISLPRMELCGALLLARLIEKIKSTLSTKHLQIQCWSDSKVVLAWLQGDINRWEKYVANRVSQINSIIPSKQWNYVKSEENSADCAARGLSPSQLLTFKLWWEGPIWLKTYNFKNSQQNDNNLLYLQDNELCDTLTANNKCCVATYKNSEVITKLLNKYSSFKRVIRVLAWILRFINTSVRKNNKNGVDKEIVSLSSEEITKATEMVIKNVQRMNFGDEIECLKKNNPIPTKSNILKLTPFLDKNGILRVKGRLINSVLPPESKHPIILPATGRLTELIIQEAHREVLHGGARLTLAYLRLKYWIIGGNRTVKKELRQCIRCHRFKSQRNMQIMADLPKERVTPSRPFTNTGVDFTGHVDIKINKGRGVKTCKAYIAIFICMVTKAVHLELVSDLTTQTFLAAFKRRCARRGTPKHMFSDNGTNFVGAARLLQEDFERNRTFQSSEFYDEMNNLKINWHFNAPLWPSAGGLWEAAVKSMKYHLKRVLGEQKLTYEQFTTLLTQIEACLNSRPLCPLSEDVEDLDYLTPGHFLVGGPLLSMSKEEEDFNQYDLRNRWRLVEQTNLHIWKRWSNEYLQQLQVRSKWQQTKENLAVGDLVLVTEENLPPGRWALGRVVELHPGTDGNVRVVTLKTKKGQLKRPIVKLSPLPLRQNLQTTEVTEDVINIQQEQSEPKKQKRQRGRTINKTSLLSLVLMCMMTIMGITQATPITTSNYKVTSILNNQPIYFDEAGKLQLIHDEWTLLIYYNLTSYWQATSKIKFYLEQVDTLCQRIVHEYPPCEAVVDHLRYELNHLTEYNSMLLAQHSRKKRGYFDGVGKLAGTLFGVLDVDFAQKYEQDIQYLQASDNYLLQLMKNQTLIVEAENSMIKRSSEFMDKQFKTVQIYMNQTCRAITKIENRAQILYTINDIHSAAVTSTLILSDLHRIQEMLMNALANIYKGHLDTHLFSASQLIEQLNIISGKLPQGLSLPIKDMQRDFQVIYELIHVKARITRNYLLFELHIPLLSDEDYKIYRVIPVPFMRQGHLKLVKPFSDFIAINLIKNSYITLEEQDMHHCTSYGEDEFSCISRQPVYSLHDKDAPCETKVFSQQTSLSCVINDITCKETWIKLHKPNVWLFTLCDKQLMRVICSDQVTPAVIDGTGVIALKPKCLLQKKDATIFTYNHLGSRVNTELDIEVPVINTTINNMFDIGWRNVQLNITELDNAGDLSKLDRQISYQKQHEVLPAASSISPHDVYFYSATSLLLGGLAILGMYFIIKKRRIIRIQNSTASTKLEQQKGADKEVEIEMREIRSSTRQEPGKGFSFDEISSN